MQYHVPVDLISDWNHLDSDTIYIGQSLIVGNGSAVISPIKRSALEIELVLYMARALRDKAEAWYTEGVAEITKLRNEAKQNEENLILICKDEVGDIMSMAEVRRIYLETAAYKKYDASRFENLLNQVKTVYENELATAEKMEQFVADALEQDHQLIQHFN